MRLEDGTSVSPVTLSWKEPVSRLRIYTLLSGPLFFRPLDHGFLCLFDIEAVQEVTVDGRPVSGKSFSIKIGGWLYGSYNWQAELFSKFPIPLILSGYSHNGSRPEIGRASCRERA